MRSFFLMFILLFCFIFSESVNAAWYEGGTLHQASLAEWSAATAENRLATSSDFFIKAAQMRLPDLYAEIMRSKSKKEFSIKLLPYAHGTERCITTAIKGLVGKVSGDVTFFAAICFLEVYDVDAQHHTIKQEAQAQRKVDGGNIRTATHAEIEKIVYAWASAWSSKNIGDYFGFYSESSFLPGKFTSLNAWKAQRRKTINAAGSIRVTLTDMKVSISDADHADVIFTQDYQSDSHRDKTKKKLSLQRENGCWKIIREGR